ncbi:ExeM/NucH family extracellular endonuclease [Leifsonia sp. A12D58]|uniref:ExeM/NucH family extracellular endonuclease n=1 Tax=Leifsonia sp. A12D58 TaxID=3397674 RepID=UPI0039E1F62F
MNHVPLGSAHQADRPAIHNLWGRQRTVFALVTAAAVGLSSLIAAPAWAAEVNHTIEEVQGPGAASPLVGSVVTVEGIVTADHRVGGYKGIYIQSAGSGGDAPAGDASNAVFVFLNNSNPGVAIGDLVRVTGSVSEYFGLTQITASAAGAVELVTAGVGVPAVTPLADTAVGADRERLESMLVEPTGTYRLGSSHQLYNFGTLWLSAGDAPLVKSTEQVRPGEAANAIAAENRANRLFLDDGYSIQVSNKDHLGEQPYFTTDSVVRLGDKVTWPAQPYVLSYGFDDWRLQPTVPIDNTSPADYKPTFEASNPRTEAPPEVGGTITAASFNVYNYFTTLTSENSAARGAATQAQFDIQKSKIVSAINGLDADVVSLMEIENSVKLGKPIDSALADLVSGLNAALGSEVWAFVPTPAALNDAAITDAITTAIIYKKAAVTPVGASQTQVDETVWNIAREPIAQTFSFNGKTITVVANHFKSKSGDGAEPADGQGLFNAERVMQAKAVVKFVGDLQESSGSSDVLLLGDFNAYAQEDPLNVFAEAGYVDLVPDKTDDQYTYSFNGELGSLDHAIATPSLAATVTGTGVWGINSAEWSDRGYGFGATEAGTPYRSSDHDPIVVGISDAVVPVDINVVTVNDFHGRIEQASPSGGAAVLSGAVKQIRAENPNTIFAAAGDLVGASTFTSFIQNDNPTIDALNAAGLDVSSVGNHEFDQGFADLTDRIAPRALWEYLGANVYDKTTGKPALPEYFVKSFSGVSVGFIGAVTNDLPSLVSPSGIANLDIRDVTTEVNRVADNLRDGDAANGEADVIILLVHEGAATTNIASATDNSSFGKIVNGVDSDVNAIVSGHTHLAYNHVINGRPVVSSGQYGEKFGVMDISVNPQSKELLSISNTVLPLMDTTKTPPVALYPADPAVTPIVAAATAEANVLGAVKVGDITGDFNRAKAVSGAENRGGESTLGNFVADVQLWSAQSAGAQIAFMNPGGLRTDLKFASSGAGDPDGNLTYKEAASVQPFANTLVTMNLTGAQVKQVLEQQWQPTGAARPFLKLGVSKALSYTYDPAAAAGARVTHILLNGTEIDPAASYVVVVNSFLASGGDNFAAFASGTGIADTGKVDLQSMVDYFKATATASPDYAQRAVGVTQSAPDADGYSAGDVVTLGLSSLLFSAGEPTGATVDVSLSGTSLGNAAIDPAIVDTTDEVGRASLSITIPDGVSGVQQLVISVAGTGTAIAVPITITKKDVPVPVKVGSTTDGSASKLLASQSSTVKYTVTVKAAGKSTVKPTGTVTVYDGRKAIATVTLTADSNGKATITLPKLSRGLHVLTSQYSGSDLVKSSTSWPDLLIVF